MAREKTRLMATNFAIIPADEPSSFKDFCTLVAKARISLSVEKNESRNR